MNEHDGYLAAIEAKLGRRYAIMICQGRSQLIADAAAVIRPVSPLVPHDEFARWMGAFFIGVSEAQRISKLETTK